MERQWGVVVGGATEGRGGVVVGRATEGRGGVVVDRATEGRGGVVVGGATEGERKERGSVAGRERGKSQSAKIKSSPKSGKQIHIKECLQQVPPTSSAHLVPELPPLSQILNNETKSCDGHVTSPTPKSGAKKEIIFDFIDQILGI